MEDKETLESIFNKYARPYSDEVKVLQLFSGLKALQEAYNLGVKALAEKSKEKIAKDPDNLGKLLSIENIDSTLKELVK